MMRLFKRKGRKSNQKEVASALSTESQVAKSEPQVAPLEIIQAPVPQSAPFRTSFFQSAKNIGISGGQFNSTRGHHTNLTINFNQGGIEPVLDFQQEVANSMQPIFEENLPVNDNSVCMGLGIDLSKEASDLTVTETDKIVKPPTPPKPATPPIQKSSDIYYRQLSVKELGYPLWIPEPNNRLPVKYQRRGIQIGDVGIITPSGSFDFLFNICSSATDPINPRELPEGFAPLHPPLDPMDTRGHLEFKPNSYLASASIERSRGEENGDIRYFAFESSASEGAILTMPDGAYSEDLGNVAKFRKYLAANAEHWYRYVNGVRGREALNGDVRLVIGCHKTTTWGMATFSDLRERKDFRLQFRPTGEDSRVGRTYGWEYSGMAEVRAGPDPQEIEDLRMQEESEAGVMYRNQCLFIRTLNVTLRDDIWKQLLSELELGFDLDNSQPEDFDPTRPQSPSSNNASGPAKGKGPTHQPHNANSLATNTFEQNVHIPGLKRVLTPHPSKAINEMLLADYPKARMAITEDSDWMFLIREDDTTLPSPETLCARIRATFSTNYDLVDGVASLQPKGIISKMFGDYVTALTESPSHSLQGLSSHSSALSSGSTLDGNSNPSPSSRSITLSGSTLDSGYDTDEQGQQALRSIGMNRSPRSVIRPLPPRSSSGSRSRRTKLLPKLASGTKPSTNLKANAERTSPLASLPPSLDTIPSVDSRPIDRQVKKKDEGDKLDRGSHPPDRTRARRPGRKVLFRKSKMGKTRSSGVGVDGYLSNLDADKELDDRFGSHGRRRMTLLPDDDGVGDLDGAFTSTRSRARWEDDLDVDVPKRKDGVGRRAVAKIVSLIR